MSRLGFQRYPMFCIAHGSSIVPFYPQFFDFFSMGEKVMGKVMNDVITYDIYTDAVQVLHNTHQIKEYLKYKPGGSGALRQIMLLPSMTYRTFSVYFF